MRAFPRLFTNRKLCAMKACCLPAFRDSQWCENHGMMFGGFGGVTVDDYEGKASLNVERR